MSNQRGFGTRKEIDEGKKTTSGERFEEFCVVLCNTIIELKKLDFE